MTTKHTRGPWFSDAEGRIWRRDPSDLYQNGGGVAGDKPLAVASAGWIGEGVTGYPIKDNARLIAAAPDLLEALKIMVRDYAAVHAGTGDLEMSPALLQAQRAIDRATGEQP